MNKKYVACLALLFLISAVILCFSVIKKPERAASDEASAAFSLKSVNEARSLFTVKANGEKIGVYASANDKLFLSLDTYLFTLPEKDRVLIENGFSVDKNEVFHVVEDYTG